MSVPKDEIDDSIQSIMGSLRMAAAYYREDNDKDGDYESSRAKQALLDLKLKWEKATKIGWANEFIKKSALPEGDEGPEFARGWNAYRNKCLAEKAKLKKRLSKEQTGGDVDG